MTVEQIATRAEYAKGTIYRHFPSKDDIYVRLAADWLADTHAALAAIDADRPFETVFREALAICWRRATADRVHARILRHVQRPDYLAAVAPETRAALLEADARVGELLAGLVELGVDEGGAARGRRRRGSPAAGHGGGCGRGLGRRWRGASRSPAPRGRRSRTGGRRRWRRARRGCRPASRRRGGRKCRPWTGSADRSCPWHTPPAWRSAPPSPPASPRGRGGRWRRRGRRARVGGARGPCGRWCSIVPPCTRACTRGLSSLSSRIGRTPRASCHQRPVEPAARRAPPGRRPGSGLAGVGTGVYGRTPGDAEKRRAQYRFLH